MAESRAITSDKLVSVQIVRRQLMAPDIASAAPRHEYQVVFTTRAAVKSRSGSSEWAQVEVDGKKATHTFTIRYTTIPFDARDRVRDARGQLYQILSVETVDLGYREMRLHCASQGQENVPAAR